MAEAPKKQAEQKETAGAKAPTAERRTLGIQLMPVGNSDQPVLANYCTVNVAPGMAFIDLGFLEPGLLSALPRLARQGTKLPDRVNGKLAVRVAMGYDAIANLHQQLERVLAGLRAAGRDKKTTV